MPVAVGETVVHLSAERRVLSQLVTDAAAIDEVEDAVAAADLRFAVAGQVIGESNTRREVLVGTGMKLRELPSCPAIWKGAR